MPRRISQLEKNRRSNVEEMFVSQDEKSLRRGRRGAPRTQACRPCLVWSKEAPDKTRQGVVLDLNPRGLRVRMLDLFSEGTEVVVQMMRDDEFRNPLSPPIRARVVRVIPGTAGFIDHGLKVELAETKRPEESRPMAAARPRVHRRTVTRVHTADHFGAPHGARRSGRGRG